MIHDPSLPATLAVRPWPDPVIDAVGHDLRSAYVERYWLPILGPSCTLLLRQLAERFDREPEGFTLDVAACARSLGLGGGLGRQAPLGRAITRCSQFGATQRFGPAGVVVRRKLPTMARHHLARLPEALQADHARWVGAAAPRGGGPPTDGGGVAPIPLLEPARPGAGEAAGATAAASAVGRARHLALTLVELGEDDESVRRQLLRWRYPPAISAEAARWAAEQRAAGPHEPAVGPVAGRAVPDPAVVRGDVPPPRLPRRAPPPARPPGGWADDAA